MRTVEECYDYVLARCAELENARRRKRRIAVNFAAPVSAAIVAGTAFALVNSKREITEQSAVNSENTAYYSSINSSESNADASVSASAENDRDFQNEIKIGEVAISDSENMNFFIVPPLYEMSRAEVLEHFGLSADFDLSNIVEGLRETAPLPALFNPDGKHGFCREMTDGEWGEVLEMYENDVFRFEKDGDTWAEVVFSRTPVPWWRNCIFINREEFESLPKSVIADTEMTFCTRIFDGRQCGYYAEFKADDFYVGLTTVGLSESDTVKILECLAVFTRASNSPQCDDYLNVNSAEIAVGDIN